jgi:hypothetical protein
LTGMRFLFPFFLKKENQIFKATKICQYAPKYNLFHLAPHLSHCTQT